MIVVVIIISGLTNGLVKIFEILNFKKEEAGRRSSLCLSRGCLSLALQTRILVIMASTEEMVEHTALHNNPQSDPSAISELLRR